MSFVQECEKIKRDIGEEKWGCIDMYIKYHHPELRFNQIIYDSDNWKEFQN